MKHNFEERKENRIRHAEEQAAKNRQKSTDLWEHSNDLTKHIPPGQPILVGHHSEKRHRKTLEKSYNAMGQSVQADKKADYYTAKAASIMDNNAIASDDPQALEKLTNRLNHLEEWQAMMKKINQCIRKKDMDTFLTINGTTTELWNKLNGANRFGEKGYPHYKLTNNNADIRRIRLRIQELTQLSQLKTTEQSIKGIQVVHNTEANRIQLIFPGKPPKNIREQLVKNGFRWCRSENAWQRHLNNQGIYAANSFLETYSPNDEIGQ